ncbi:MAG: hypothetical protein AB8I08_36740 [Sandaracinaceae bacterium]
MTLWVLLLGSLYFVIKLESVVEMAAGARLDSPATVLFWVPDSVVATHAVFDVAVVLYLICAAGWFLNVLVPWCSWGAAIAFTVLGALAVENLPGGGHAFNATNMLLWVHAFWVHRRRAEIRSALREERYWTTRLYPQWVFWVSLAYLVLFHAAAGFTKLAFSGLSWPDGVTLQLWAFERGRATLPRLPIANPFSAVLIHHHWVARVAGVSVLALEVGSVSALFSSRLRWVVGVGLLGFYGINFLTFDFGAMFLPNACLTALFFLPVSRACAVGAEGASRGRFPAPKTALARFLVRRLDAFGWFARRS